MEEAPKSMDIPFASWYEAIALRRSRRNYDGVELDHSALDRLRTVCREFRPFAGARAEVVMESPDRILKGAVGTYGKVKGAPALVAFIGDMQDPHVQEKAGYLGEGIVLEATAMGLATCWVGGFFRQKAAALAAGTAPDERVLAVTPVGHALDKFTPQERIMSGFGMMHRRKPLQDLVMGTDVSRLLPWMRAALEAARAAPSAVNRQPWRFHVHPDGMTVYADSTVPEFGISKRLDCGIAMLHIEVSALNSGVQGRWEFLNEPEVARFAVSGP